MSTSTSGNENGVLMMETELIRCKDCKHWQYESCFVDSEEGDADSIILDRFAFDFCSRAERRNNVTVD